MKPKAKMMNRDGLETTEDLANKYIYIISKILRTFNFFQMLAFSAPPRRKRMIHRRGNSSGAPKGANNSKQLGADQDGDEFKSVCFQAIFNWAKPQSAGRRSRPWIGPWPDNAQLSSTILNWGFAWKVLTFHKIWT